VQPRVSYTLVCETRRASPVMPPCSVALGVMTPSHRLLFALKMLARTFAIAITVTSIWLMYSSLVEAPAVATVPELTAEHSLLPIGLAEKHAGLTE